jgi:hypothetical protein
MANERLECEGEAQQERATEQLKALRKEVEVEQHGAWAVSPDQREKAARRAKES